MHSTIKSMRKPMSPPPPPPEPPEPRLPPRKDAPPPGRASATAESVNTTTAHDNATRAAICGQRGTSCSLRRNSRALAAAQREATAFGSGNLIAQFVLVVGLSRQHLRKWLCERQHAV